MTQFTPEKRRIKQLYDFSVATAGRVPEEVDVSVVYGRKSKQLLRVASAVAQVTKGGKIISGNIGKDSGDLPAKGVPEARYVVDGIHAKTGIPKAEFLTDLKAKNGLDNAKNSIGIIMDKERGLGLTVVGSLATVIHATSLRRLGGTFDRQVKQTGLNIGNTTHVATDYLFDADNMFDAYEVAGEVQRVWNLSDPAKGDSRWLDRPSDITRDMYDYAVDLDKHYQAEFDRLGILNPSTADGTDHYRPMYTA